MKTKVLMALTLFICAAAILFSSRISDTMSQAYPGLDELTGFSIQAYYSPGNEERARIIAERCEKAMNYVNRLVGFRPKVSLFVLNPEHWKKYATFPVYGMADQIKRAYTVGDGTLSMTAFFDLLALHELGHAFHEQAGLTMPRLWIQELFSNLMLHTYIAENEPEKLPVLEIFPETVVAAGGERALIKLWQGLRENKETMIEAQLADFLKTKVSQEAARVQTDWL